MRMGQEVVHLHSFAKSDGFERPVHHIAVRGGIQERTICHAPKGTHNVGSRSIGRWVVRDTGRRRHAQSVTCRGDLCHELALAVGDTVYCVRRLVPSIREAETLKRPSSVIFAAQRLEVNMEGLVVHRHKEHGVARLQAATVDGVHEVDEDESILTVGVRHLVDQLERRAITASRTRP